MADTLTAALAYIQHIVDHDHRLYCREGACVATCVNGRAVLSAQPPKSVEWFKERMREQVAFEQVNPYLPPPAATQEPAGSGAMLSNVVCSFNEQTYCLDVASCTGSGVCQYPMFKGKREVGSPRKVGEDATMAIVHLAHEIQEQHRAVGPEPTTYPCQVACKCGAQIEAISRDALTVVFVNHIVMEALARSSSVPVGEQKQEEGV